MAVSLEVLTIAFSGEGTKLISSSSSSSWSRQRRCAVRRVGTRSPMATATVERMTSHAIVGKEKAVNFMARAVVTVRRKRKEDLKETIANQFDAYSEKLIRRSVLLELIGTEIDPSMESLKKIVYTDHHEKVSKAFFRAENWQALCGPHVQIERYAIATENALTCFPRSLEEDNAIQGRLVDLFQEQAHNVCIQVEILVAMKYLQKARLEAFATKDNYASDKLGHVDASIQKLIQCHDMLVECYYQKHY